MAVNSTPEARRAYQRAYYLKHREKAKEYQRNYIKGKKNSTTRGRPDGRMKKVIPVPREIIKSSYSCHSLQSLTLPKFILVVNMIINNEVMYTGI